MDWELPARMEQVRSHEAANQLPRRQYLVVLPCLKTEKPDSAVAWAAWHWWECHRRLMSLVQTRPLVVEGSGFRLSKTWNLRVPRLLPFSSLELKVSHSGTWEGAECHRHLSSAPRACCPLDPLPLTLLGFADILSWQTERWADVETLDLRETSSRRRHRPR